MGRGGWTWYTGSAGWLYRAGLEAILGFRLRGNCLMLEPCIPVCWPGFEMTYRHGSARYMISVSNPDRVQHGVASATVDGEPLEARPCRIELQDDGGIHRVELTMGTAR